MKPECLSSAPIENLVRRSKLAKTLRDFFQELGFVEVHTPILSRYCVIDRHLDPIRVSGRCVGIGGDQDWYLQTSPEQSMKRLLASGLGSCYQLGSVFRSSEFGQFHNPEFTMAEWYDVSADLSGGLNLLDNLLMALLGTPSAERMRFESAFKQATELELFECDAETLGRWAVDRRLVDRSDWASDWDDWVNLIFSHVVQPSLGQKRPVLVTHFPASQAALAKLDPQDPRTAERYEAFYLGVELANGYHELCDPDELARRAAIANEQRIADGKFALPLESPLVDAMRYGIPSSCGCALGFDRVVMLACGAKSLSEVIPFTAPRA
ncbi:MAG: elongation factor P--(R)-beta-lysine ligase [Pirellula sp.]